jgi:hypothetical protein
LIKVLFYFSQLINKDRFIGNMMKQIRYVKKMAKQEVKKRKNCQQSPVQQNLRQQPSGPPPTTWNINIDESAKMDD